MKNKYDAKKKGFDITDETLVYEAVMAQNLMLNYGGSTPANALLGYTPNDFYDPQSPTLESHSGALQMDPDTFESNLRTRIKSKENVLRTIVEERITAANNTKPQKMDETITAGCDVDLYRTPERKDQLGWRGPCPLLDLSNSGAVVVWNGYPYIVPLRMIRKHRPPSGWVGRKTYHQIIQNEFDPKRFLLTEFAKFLDIVEGSTPFKTFITGRIF